MHVDNLCLSRILHPGAQLKILLDEKCVFTPRRKGFQEAEVSNRGAVNETFIGFRRVNRR